MTGAGSHHVEAAAAIDGLVVARREGDHRLATTPSADRRVILPSSAVRSHLLGGARHPVQRCGSCSSPLLAKKACSPAENTKASPQSRQFSVRSAYTVSHSLVLAVPIRPPPGRPERTPRVRLRPDRATIAPPSDACKANLAAAALDDGRPIVARGSREPAGERRRLAPMPNLPSGQRRVLPVVPLILAASLTLGGCAGAGASPGASGSPSRAPRVRRPASGMRPAPPT